MKRKLIIDGQIFQTPALHRGMGKYSFDLISQIARQSREEWSDINLILSKKVSTDPELITKLSTFGPKLAISELDLLPSEDDFYKIAKHNKKIVDKYISDIAGTNTVDYLVLSLMQREIYPVFPSDVKIQKFLLFYDLIPLMFPRLYLQERVKKADYLSRLAELIKADRFLAISKTVANDLASYLGIDNERITSIDGGPINHSEFSQEIIVPHPFILMPTGNDYRKNNRRGIEGFNSFNRIHDNRYSLVITSFFEPNEINELQQLSNNITFTGNIDGSQLSYLFEQAEGILFPAEYEGLGLPVLEAVEKNKPVACSDISVFKEISPDAFHYFNPYETNSIAAALSEMVGNPKIKIQEYESILSSYTWENTVNKLLSVRRLSIKANTSPKKLAVFGLWPELEGSNNSMLVNSHAELSRCFMGIDYYLGGSESNDNAGVNFLPYITKVKPIEPGFNLQADQYSSIMYYIGNNPDYSLALFTALSVPGIVALHDLELVDTWLEMVNQNLVDQSRYALEKEINKSYGINGYLVSLIRNQKAILVFDEKVKSGVSRIISVLKVNTKIYQADLPFAPLPYPEIISPENVNEHKPNHKVSYKQFAHQILNVVEGING